MTVLFVDLGLSVDISAADKRASTVASTSNVIILFSFIFSQESKVREIYLEGPANQRSLEISSWKSLSVSLSRGAVAEIENERARIIGLDKDGFLCVEVDGREVLVSDAHTIKWNYP